MTTSYVPPQTKPSLSIDASGAPRKLSSVSVGSNGIRSMHSNHHRYRQTALSCPATPRGGIMHNNNNKSSSCPTTPVGTTQQQPRSHLHSNSNSNSGHPFFPSSPTIPRNGHPAVSFATQTLPGGRSNIFIAPRTTASGASKENSYYDANHHNLMQPKHSQQPQQQNTTQNQWNNNNSNNNSNSSRNKKEEKENPVPLGPVSPSKEAFAKSQADLNRSYWQRRAKFLQMPIAARFETGRNLKHLRPLAIRTAEFC